LVDSQSMVIGGTSAVAPMWAALAVCLNVALGKRVGFINPALYALGAPSPCFNDITQGNNGTFVARGGWDPCTGLGTPIGVKILQALQGTSAPPSSGGGGSSPTPQAIAQITTTKALTGAYILRRAGQLLSPGIPIKIKGTIPAGTSNVTQ
jgi:kumamolisin